MMRVSTMTVYRLVHAGELPAVRFGRSYRIPESAVAGVVGVADTDVQAG
jgi:excisionase family DNA binding protein